jgi:hypothetical protein
MKAMVWSIMPRAMWHWVEMSDTNNLSGGPSTTPLYLFHTASVTFRFLFLVGLKSICQIPRVRVVHRNSLIEKPTYKKESQQFEHTTTGSWRYQQIEESTKGRDWLVQRNLLPKIPRVTSKAASCGISLLGASSTGKPVEGQDLKHATSKVGKLYLKKTRLPGSARRKLKTAIGDQVITRCV